MARGRAVAIFEGQVQGVGFRATARSIALEHAVGGWVRNEPDGTVRLEAEGERPAVEAFLDAVGRAMARRIRRVDVRWQEATGGEADFRIARPP